MNFNKKTILQLILFLWLVFSVVFIGNTIWSNYKKVQLANEYMRGHDKGYSEGYDEGYSDSINDMIIEAEKCEAFSIFNDNKKVLLMNLDCLKTDDLSEGTIESD